MESANRQKLEARLKSLKQEHRELDSQIEVLTAQTGFDQIRVQRLKKRKLAIKDEISALENSLLPDIIA